LFWCNIYSWRNTLFFLYLSALVLLTCYELKCTYWPNIAAHYQ
jgi:hypothetical protein